MQNKYQSLFHITLLCVLCVVINLVMHSYAWAGLSGEVEEKEIKELQIKADLLKRAGPKDAINMVKKGVLYYKKNGRDKAFTEFNNKKGQFIDNDLYIYVSRNDGTTLANGFNEKLIGKNIFELRDIDRREFVKERLAIGKTKPEFWHGYKFSNPVTKKIEQKAAYCERIEDFFVCVGIYGD